MNELLTDYQESAIEALRAEVERSTLENRSLTLKLHKNEVDKHNTNCPICKAV